MVRYISQMYISRTLETFLTKASNQFPVLVISGPRQVGKTTILRHISQSGRAYVSLDDPKLALLAREEPSLFLQRFAPPVLIDEIQYAPELLPHIKIWVDREKQNGLFWLTGSQQFQLMKGVTESLAGRAAIVSLLGLSQYEIGNIANQHKPFLPTRENLVQRESAAARIVKTAKIAGDMAAAEAANAAANAARVAANESYPTKEQIAKILDAAANVAVFVHVREIGLRSVYERIWRGAFPSIALNAAIDRDLFYSSYVQTYLQRDVRSLASIGDEGSFLKFLRAAAARTGQIVNLSDMARDVAISVPTAKRWLGILEASGIIYLLQACHSNRTTRLIKAPKLYFLDTGLCAYLTEWTSASTLEAGAMSGAILETYIFAEILKSYWYNGKQAPLFYYRDKEKGEIDLLIIRDDTVYPVEFKKTATPDRNAIRHFRLLDSLSVNVGEGGVICLSESLLPITTGVTAIPVSLV
jgi:uncharacterized protein